MLKEKGGGQQHDGGADASPGTPVSTPAVSMPAADTGPAGRRDRETLWIDRLLAKKAATAERTPVVPAPAPAPAPALPQRRTPAPPPTPLLPTPLPTPPPSPASSPAEPPAPTPDAAPAPLRADSPPRTPDPAAPATVTPARLLALPPAVAAQLAGLSSGFEVPDTLLRALWAALETNTRELTGDWRFIPPAVATRLVPPPAMRMTDAGARVQARFADILPVAASAIPDPVHAPELGVRDYLHANHVGLDCGLRMIAAQKPVGPEIAGFHRMLLDQNVALVVDLTRYVEREPHVGYAPERKGGVVAGKGGRLLVSCIERARVPTLKAVRQRIVIDDGFTAYVLQRLRFPGWPDHGVVAVADLLALADEVDLLTPDPQRAVVVHCLAGVGRTGTLMSFIAARRRIAAAVAAGEACSAALVLRHALQAIARGRADRGPSFVQMEGQFQLLVQALLANFAGRPAGTPYATATAAQAVGLPSPAAPAREPATAAGRGRSVWRRVRDWFG